MAVMGSSLARNMARHGYRVALFNRTYSRTQQVVADARSCWWRPAGTEARRA